MSRKTGAAIILIVLASAIVVALVLVRPQVAKILVVKYWGSNPQLRGYDLPQRTGWGPVGPRTFCRSDRADGRQQTFFKTFHADLRCSSELSVAIAPVFKLDWVAEKDMWIGEGPTFDRHGNVYFCPVWPREEVILVSLDGRTGARRWAIKGFSHGGGAPLVLDDPSSQDQIIYLGTYDRAVAVRPDGTIVWDVATGLPGLQRLDDPTTKHCFGLNYHIQADAVVGVVSGGHIYALDRVTGRQLLDSPYLVPGEKARKVREQIPENLAKKIDEELAPFFVRSPGGASPFKTIMKALLAEGIKIANYFSIDPDTGRMWVGATAAIGGDEKPDMGSEYGALYGMDLVCTDGKWSLRVASQILFRGGTASTPVLSADGQRVYVGDGVRRLIAVDTSNGKEVWSLDLGDFLICSATVTADNGEIYVTTMKDYFKIVDRGNSGELVWRAPLDMYRTGMFQQGMAIIGPTAGANGLVVQAGAGHVTTAGPMPVKCGVGLLDRETGALRYFAEGVEESVSATSVGPDGGIYLAHSPLRRALARAVFGENLPALSGGIARFKPVRLDLLIRDALWAASKRAANAFGNVAKYPEAAKADMRQIRDLMEQCRSCAPRALGDGDLKPETWKAIEGILGDVENKLNLKELAPVAVALGKASDLIEQGTVALEEVSINTHSLTDLTKKP